MRKTSIAFISTFFLLTTSCEEILLEQDISNSTVELLAPAEDAVLESSAVNFHWTEVPGASGYNFQIATPNFSAAQQIITDIILEETTFSEEMEVNNYEWRVKALNSGYFTGFSSAKFEVKDVEDFSGRQVNLISPDENYTINHSDLSLNWNKVEEANLYRIQVLQDDRVVMEKTSSENKIQVQFPEGESIWRIRAENDTQNTLYSERNILVDVTAPYSPILLQPANETQFSSGSVSFQWQREAIPGSVEIDSLYIFSNSTLSEMVIKVQVNNSFSTSLEGGETYYWQMKTYDSAGNIGAGSSLFSFTIN